MNFKHIGYLAQAFSGKNLPLQVLRSAAGFYIGTWDEGPNSRESVEYFATSTEADKALRSGNWTQRPNP